jgi:hypothetical protein
MRAKLKTVTDTALTILIIIASMIVLYGLMLMITNFG